MTRYEGNHEYNMVYDMWDAILDTAKKCFITSKKVYYIILYTTGTRNGSKHQKVYDVQDRKRI